MKKLVALLCVLTFAWLGVAFWQPVFGDENVFKPNELQQLRLQVRQQQAQIAQKDVFIAQQNFKVALAALGEEGAKVKTENGWPSTVLFNQETLSFAAMPNPTAPPAPTIRSSPK